MVLRLSTVAPEKVLTATSGFSSLVLIPFRIELPTNSVDLCITLVGLVVRSIVSTSSLAVTVISVKASASFLSLYAKLVLYLKLGLFSLGFRICLSFVVFVFTLFLAVLLSVSFGFLYDLFGSIFCRACGLFVILFRVSV